MAIIDIIGAFSASGFLGGITGLIGNELKSRRELKMVRLKGELERDAWPERERVRLHEAQMKSNSAAHEIALHELNAKARAEEDERAILANEAEYSGKGLIAALKADMTPAGAAVPEYRFVGAVRSLVRPVLCVSLVIATMIAFAFSPNVVRAKIVAALLYLTTLAVAYYYGDRPTSAMKKMLIGGG